MSSMFTSAEEQCHLVKQKLLTTQSMLAATQERSSQLEQDNAGLEQSVASLSKHNEDLQQSNYSLSLKLSSTQQTLSCCSSELESLQEQLDNQAQAIRNRLEQQHQTQLENARAKHRVSEQRCEAAEAEVARFREQLTLAGVQLLEAQEALTNVSVCAPQDDALHTQIAALTCEKQDLTTRLSRAVGDRDDALQQLDRLQTTAHQLSTDLEDRECQLTGHYNEIQRLKEDLVDHDQELEMYRMNAKDPGVKGNSLFAEVEDHRLFLEKQMVVLKKNYDLVVYQYELKVKQISRLKLQVASLLSLSTTRDDGEYVTHLNESLRISRNNISALKEQVEEMTVRIRQEKERPLVVQCLPTGCTSRSPYYLNTFQANQKELSQQKNFLQETRFSNVVLSDQILGLQRKLHQAACCLDAQKAQNIRLTVQLQNIEAKKGIFEADQPQKTWTEILPGFEKTVQSDNTGSTTSVVDKTTEDAHTKLDASKDVPEPSRNMSSKTDCDVLLESVRGKRKFCQEGKERKRFCVDDDMFDESSAANSNKENCGAAATARKVKKTVRLQDTVDVQESTGDRSGEPLKSCDGSLKLRRPIKMLEPVAPQMDLPICQQQ